LSDVDEQRTVQKPIKRQSARITSAKKSSGFILWFREWFESKLLPYAAELLQAPVEKVSIGVSFYAPQKCFEMQL